MNVALKMPYPLEDKKITDEGRKSAHAYALFLGRELRQALSKERVFNNGELDAIEQSFVEVLQQNGSIDEKSLAKALHSRSIPKDLAFPLARALSRDR